MDDKKKVGFREAFRRFRSFIDNERDLLLADILFETGCTLSEALNIKNSDVDSKKSTLNLPHRIVKISYDLSGRLKKHPGYVFRVNKSIISKRRVEQLFSQYSAKSGIKITPRLLRRFYMNTKLQAQENVNLTSVSLPVPDLSAIKFPKRERDLLVLAILYETGCKTSELANLKVRDVRNGKLHFPDKSMLLSSKLYSKLKSFTTKRKNSEALFLTASGSRLTPRRIQQVISACSDNQITPRDFRKHFVYRQLKKGNSAEEVKKLLGLKRIDLFTHGIAEVKYEFS